MDYFTKSETLSVQWPLTYAGNKLYLHKKENHYWLLILTNLGENVADGIVPEPKCNFQHWQDKIQ